MVITIDAIVISLGIAAISYLVAKRTTEKMLDRFLMEIEIIEDEADYPMTPDGKFFTNRVLEEEDDDNE